ncbi:MAG: RagB/SusD family nutrient uptake outer membrane protein, partial [Prevotellaceae bacterium]|nr:RagB/SusD family nutrient uptake outer membrane protein [Prevotellaceae bacterium]
MKSFSLMLLCIAMAACNSLDQLPTNQFTDDVFWSSLDRANMMLNMAYNQMYGVDKLWQDEALSDNLIEARGGSDVTLIREGQANSSTGIFKSEWKWCYQGIKTSNVFIDHVDLIPDAAPAVKAAMVAQVRFIRAYLYFRLSNFYGDIPFFLNDITMSESKAMTRTSRANVLATLHQELDDIIPELPKKEDLSAAERGRITKAAAVVLKARIYLLQGDMENVKKYCGYLIDNQADYGAYSLFTTSTPSYSAYENLFSSAFEYNDEVILDYTYVPLTRTWGNFVDMVPQAVPNSRVTGRVPTQSLVESYITRNGLPVRGAYTKPVPYANDPSYDESNPYVNR